MIDISGKTEVYNASLDYDHMFRNKADVLDN